MLDRLPGRIVAGAMLLIFGGAGGRPAFGGEMLTDPTRPAVSVADDSAHKTHEPLRWRLNSTLIGAQRRVAVINDQAVRIGQKIDGAVLLAVGPGSARLLYDGREILLKLNTKTVKTAP